MVDRALAAGDIPGLEHVPDPAIATRDAVLNSIVDRPRQFLLARMAGRTPEELAAQFNTTPELAQKVSDKYARKAAARMTREFNISPEDAMDVLSSSPESGGGEENTAPAEDRIAHLGGRPVHGIIEGMRESGVFDRGETDAERARDEALSELSEPARAVFESHSRGQTPDEIGARISATPENVQKRIDRITEELKKRMIAKGVSEGDANEALASSPENFFRRQYQAVAQKLATMKGAMSKREINDAIPAQKDAVTNFANDRGVKAASSIRLDLPDAKDREAMPFVIEAGDDPAKLQEFRDEVATSRDKKLADKYTPLLDHAIENFDRLNMLKANHDEIMEGSLERLAGAGYDIGHSANYVHRALDVPSEELHPNPLVDMGTGADVAPKHFTKGRAFLTLADAIHEGFAPRSTDFADLVHRRIEAGERLVEQQRLFDEWHRTPAPSDGRPVIGKMEQRKLANGKTELKIPDGYKSVQVAGAPMVVHQDVAPLLRALYSESHIRNSLAGQLALKAAAGIKHFTFAMDTYHAGRVLLKMFAAGGGAPLDLSSGSLRWNLHAGRALLEYSDADLARAVAANARESPEDREVDAGRDEPWSGL